MSSSPLTRLLHYIVIEKSQLVTVVLLVAGYCGFAGIPAFDRKNFFDENALLPWSARATLREAPGPLADTAQEVYNAIKALDAEQRSDWIRERLNGLHIQTHHHHYSSGGDANCSNLHAIVTSARGDGRECIILSTPSLLHSRSTGFHQTPSGAAFALTVGYILVRHLSSVDFLAKDLIWLIPDASCGLVESSMAWVDAYQLGGGQADFARAGLMQQAFVLEVQDARFDAAEVSVEGYNGQLPKLDVFMLVKTFTDNYLRSPAGLEDNPKVSQLLQKLPLLQEQQQYVAKLSALCQFVWRQAVGKPRGAHAAFREVGVDAATLRLVTKGKSRLREASIERLLSVAEALELVVRSCNNLLERLHHSYNLYLQTGPGSFVSVDVYVAPLLALGLALLLQAGAHKAVLDGAGQPFGDVAQQQWWAAIIVVLLTHAAGAAAAAALLLLHGGSYAATVESLWSQATTHLQASCPPLQGPRLPSWQEMASPGCCGIAGCIGLGVVTLAGVTGWLASPRPTADAASGAAILDWRKVKVVVLSTLTLLLAAVACMNWALAYLHLALLVPPVLCCRPLLSRRPSASAPAADVGRARTLMHLLQSAASVLLLLATSPATLYVLAAAGSGCRGVAACLALFPPSVAPLTLLVCCAVYVPSWLLCLWALVL